MELEQLPGCCGIAVIFELGIDNTEDDEFEDERDICNCDACSEARFSPEVLHRLVEEARKDPYAAVMATTIPSQAAAIAGLIAESFTACEKFISPRTRREITVWRKDFTDVTQIAWPLQGQTKSTI